MAWNVMSGVTRMAWDVMSRVIKTAWDVLYGVANLCGMFCLGCKKLAWDVLSWDVLSGSPITDLVAVLFQIQVLFKGCKFHVVSSKLKNLDTIILKSALYT